MIALSISSQLCITTSLCYLVWGKAYAGFEAKSIYIACVVLFEAGSALCGGAPSMNTLIVGRTIAGVGGSGLYVGVMSLLSVTTTLRERPMYVGLTGLVWGIGTVAGPIVGGAFTDSSAGWRFAFYINLIIGAVFAPVWIFLLPSHAPRKGTSYKTGVGEIDWVGTTIIVGAFVSGVMAISFAASFTPGIAGTSSPHTFHLGNDNVKDIDSEVPPNFTFVHLTRI